MSENKEKIGNKKVRELGEAHWEYSLGIIERSMNTQKLDFEQLVILCEYLYVEAFVHGYKHCRDDFIKSRMN